MKRHQKSSRYFLRHLLAREHLDPGQLARLDEVLLDGRPEDARELAIELAQELADRGIYLRLAPGLYRDPYREQNYRLPLPRVPVRSEPAPGAGEAAVRPEAPRETSPHTELGGIPQEHLREILAVLRLQTAQSGLRSGFSRLFSMLERWYPDSRHVLYHFEDLGNGDVADDPTSLRSLEPETLTVDHPYRRALSGEGIMLLDPGDPEHGWFPPRQAGREGHWMLLPLRIDDSEAGEPWGLMEFHLPGDRDLDRAISELAAIGQALTQLVHNHRFLSGVVYVDALTRVFNRSFLDLQLPLEIERATRNSEPMAMLVLDLDDFKQINDSYGHDAGDQVLRQFGDLLRETLRKVDMVFRFGGEEFVVLLPRLDEDSAIRAAERLREAISGHRFEIAADRPPLTATVSVGGAIYPRDALSEESLFRAADEACYRAKRGGKNRVCFSNVPDQPM